MSTDPKEYSISGNDPASAEPVIADGGGMSASDAWQRSIAAGSSATASSVWSEGNANSAGNRRGPYGVGWSAFWSRLGCNALVFLASVCVMAVELTASRLIANHLGQSLYTWTSVIGVVLAGISLGNFLGGWLADRFEPRQLLGWLFVISGLSTFSVLWLNQVVSGVERWPGLSWPVWVILVVATLFFAPAVSLGAISPVVANMALRNSKRTGSTVGNVYAWGAMGSIAGTFLTGFVLIEQFGTQIILVGVAISLLLLGVIVASGRWMFRGVALFGIGQLMTGLALCAIVTPEGAAAAAKTFANAGWLPPARLAGVLREDPWQNWGRDLGKHLAEVGELLYLRAPADDSVRIESSYYTVSVSPDVIDGDSVLALRLDHLTHSYFNPRNPARLYYEYEQVYAACTEHVARHSQRISSVSLPSVPESRKLLSWPEEIRWNAELKLLQCRGAMSPGTLRSLLDCTAAAAFRCAVIDLWATTQSGDAQSSVVPLDELPDGAVLPVNTGLFFRSESQELVARERLRLDSVADLLATGDDAHYVRAVISLYEQSRAVSTLFIGGGGFVFPRWIESTFPGSTRIDVAEIDPAVKAAVQKYMGLPDDANTRVKTWIGDARRFVDELRIANLRDIDAGRAPVRYQFVYGDAFNDFSVPWHLTTREFQEHVSDLLEPEDGVFLVNVIDKFAISAYPDDRSMRGEAETAEGTPLFAELLGANVGKTDWFPLRGFNGVEARAEKTETGAVAYRLRTRKPMSEWTRDRLLSRADDWIAQNGGGAVAVGEDGAANAVAQEIEQIRQYRYTISELFEKSRQQVMYSDELPLTFQSHFVPENTWTPAPAPFERLLLYRPGTAEILHENLAGGGWRFGYRGVMSDVHRDLLMNLAGTNRAFAAAIESLHQQTRDRRGGEFLGRFIATAASVFPCVYVFHGQEGELSQTRDTFVIACSRKPIDFRDIGQAGSHWQTPPFASRETAAGGTVSDSGNMAELLELARGQILTDDFAPVDNLLSPVFTDQ